jgi:hypothetical protein
VLKGAVHPDFWFSKTSRVPTVVTRKSLTVWSRMMDHRKAERVAYHNSSLKFWSFGQSEAQKFSFVQPLFCPETEFSSEVNHQTFVTSKPFVG